MKNKEHSLWSWLLSAVFLQIASWYKISCVLAGKTIIALGSAAYMPLLGRYYTTIPMVSILLFRRSVMWLVSGVSLFGGVTWYLPALCGGWYWQQRTNLYRIGLPLLCMILFWAHPIGSQSWIYAFYWIIPILVQSFSLRMIWCQALSASLTQHAVGSVLSLYIMPSTVAFWYALLPVVAVERIVYATAMTLGIYIIDAIKLYRTTITLHTKQSFTR